jgi:hypothetical protein
MSEADDAIGLEALDRNTLDGERIVALLRSQEEVDT